MRGVFSAFSQFSNPTSPRPEPRPGSPAPLSCSPSGSSTVRARRSERVRRLSCSIALSILGAPSVLPQPRRRPLSPTPYIPPRPVLRAEAPACPGHRPGLQGQLGAASSVRVSGAAGSTTEGDTPHHRRHRRSSPSCRRRRRFPAGLARPSGNSSSEPADGGNRGGATLGAPGTRRSRHA